MPSRAACHNIIRDRPFATVLALSLMSAIAVAQPTAPASQPSIADAVRALFAPTAVTADPAPSTRDPNQVQVSPTGLIDVHCRQTEISAILEMLSYQLRTNIVTSSSVKGPVSANLYGVTLTEALDAILTPNGFTHRKVGNAIFVSGKDEATPAVDAMETRVFVLQNITRSQAASAVQSVMGQLSNNASGNGGGANSGGASYPGASKESPFGALPTEKSGSEDASEEYLVVTDTPQRLAIVDDLLRKIDVRPRQVLIEATILRATLNEGNQFGIDFTLLGGIDFENVGSVSNAASDLQTGDLPPTTLQNTSFNVNTDLIGTPPSGGVSFGIIHNGVAGFLRALEEVTDVTVVANPKLVALNKQEAEVIVGRRDGYLTTTVTQTAAIQTVNFLETGTQIRVRPLINADGVVRLEVHPKDSNGGLTSANLPFEETTEAHANILVDDGHTVLIGGLFRERTVSSREQVPIIGNVPILGLPFQHRNDTTTREEVIILLTVHVLKNSDAERATNDELIADVERVRSGARTGLVGVGREQLAQAFFKEALAQAEAGDVEKALLNVRLALHNHPRHAAALELKEQLESKCVWDHEGSNIRTMLLDLLHEERQEFPHSTERFGRPPFLMGPPAPETDSKSGE